MSILIKVFDAPFQNTGKTAINAANNNSVSITYKTFYSFLLWEEKLCWQL